MRARSLLGPLAALLLALGATALLLRQPWRLTVPYRPEPEEEARDAELFDQAWERAYGSAAPGGERPSGETRPDLLLIVLDTVRADRLQGFGGEAMPRLARWAEGARRYLQARAPSPWTLPSHASYFTGLPPIRHGAHGLPYTARETASPARLARARRRLHILPLEQRFDTLAERLRAAGYRTVGIAANRAFLQSYWQLDQGFDLWLCEQLAPGRDGLPYLRGDRVASLALRALARLASEPPGQRPPFFLFVNFMDAHGPYVPREGFVQRPELLSRRYRRGRSRKRLATQVLAGRRDLPPEVRRSWLAAYDAELAFLDAQLGRLLGELERRGLADEAGVVIAADHGEYFGEHRLLAHSKDVYAPVLRVPLLERGPGVEPGEEPRPVSATRLHQRLLAWAGLAPPPPAPRGDELVVSELYGSRDHDLRTPALLARFNRVRRAFLLGSREVLLGEDGSREAYELASDPGEQRDRWGEPWTAELEARARAWIEEQRRLAEEERPGIHRSARPAPGSVPRAVLRRLQELGYVD